MKNTAAGGVLAVLLVIGYVGVRAALVWNRVERRERADAEWVQQTAEYKARMRRVFAEVATDRRLKDQARDFKIDAKFIDDNFDEVHEEALGDASSEYLYIDAFFKKMSARALAAKKNELSGSLDKVRLYAHSMGKGADVQPVAGPRAGKSPPK